MTSAVPFEIIQLAAPTVPANLLRFGDQIAVAGGGPGPLILGSVVGVDRGPEFTEVEWLTRLGGKSSTVYSSDDQVPLLHGELPR
jgi:hypothetical protein